MKKYLLAIFNSWNLFNLLNMNILRSWREQKIMLKWRYPILSDLDFDFEERDREKMLAHLAKKLSKTRLELDSLFAELQLY